MRHFDLPHLPPSASKTPDFDEARSERGIENKRRCESNRLLIYTVNLYILCSEQLYYFPSITIQVKLLKGGKYSNLKRQKGEAITTLEKI